MKYAIEMIRIEGAGVIEADVREPGKIVHHFIALEPNPIAIVRRGQPAQARAIPMLVIQTNPDAPARRRRFVIWEPNKDQPLETELELTFIAMFMTQEGQMLAIFEAPVEQPPTVDDRPAPVAGELVSS